MLNKEKELENLFLEFLKEWKKQKVKENIFGEEDIDLHSKNYIHIIDEVLINLVKFKLNLSLGEIFYFKWKFTCDKEDNILEKGDRGC